MSETYRWDEIAETVRTQTKQAAVAGRTFTGSPSARRRSSGSPPAT